MRRNWARNIVGVLLGLAIWATPTIASAHAGNDDPSVVHVCIGNVSKVVRSVGVNGTCIPGPPVVAETADHWAKTSIVGPKGDKGDKGDPGAPGVNGANGLDGMSVTFVGYFVDNQNGCANGGAIYAVGNPPVHAYVCNGSNGTDGAGRTRADAPCFDDINRYIDCGNGTVTDVLTGLIWLKQWDCLPGSTWAAANQAAAVLKSGDCGLSDNSSPGDWRLPTQAEWQATIAPARAISCTSSSNVNGPPSLTNDAGTLCYNDGVGSSFANLPSELLALLFWSSSNAGAGSFAYPANLFHGIIGEVFSKTANNFRVWPVRSGAR